MFRISKFLLPSEINLELFRTVQNCLELSLQSYDILISPGFSHQSSSNIGQEQIGCSQSSQCVICSCNYVDMMICIINMYSMRRRPCSDDTCNNYYFYNQNLFILHKIMAHLLRNKLFRHPSTYDLYGRVLISCSYNLVIIIHSLSTIYTSRINLYNRN